MNKSLGQQWLEDFQQQSYSQRGLDPNFEFIEELAEKIVRTSEPRASPNEIDLEVSKAREYFAELKGNLISKYQDPRMYGLLHSWAEELKRSGAKLSYNIPEGILVASAPVSRRNVLTKIFKETFEHVIIIDTGLFRLAHNIAVIVPQLLPVENGEFVFERSLLSQLPDLPSSILKLFCDVLLRYVGETKIGLDTKPRTSSAKTNWLNGSLPEVVPPPFFDFAQLLFDGFGLFVLGHECGHAMIQTGSDPRAINKTDTISSLDEEIEADRIAISLMTHALFDRGHDLSISCLCTGFFFIVMQIIEQTALLLTQTDNMKGAGCGFYCDDGSDKDKPPKWIESSLAARLSFLNAMRSNNAPQETIEFSVTKQVMIENILSQIFDSTITSSYFLERSRIKPS